MNFLFLKDFFGFLNSFSYFIFNFYIIKINKKIKIGGRGARVDATWHTRPRGSATRTRAAPRGAYISTVLYLLYLI